MRPVTRGDSPRPTDFENYRDAFPELVSRLGLFCSYCERRVPTQLAVEHVQPKGLPAYEHLQGRWENLLLGCVNCNSTKGEKDVVLNDVLLPDRDNTAAAYEYTEDGKITVQSALTTQQQKMANRTLWLTGLDKSPSSAADPNERLVATTRVSQRMQTWLLAENSRNDLQTTPSDAMRRQVARTATGHGFFSIWMTIFEDDRVVRKMLIDGFTGTATDCFDAETTMIVTPRPPNGLAHGSKI